MKAFITILAGFVLASIQLAAQTAPSADTLSYVMADSLVYVPTANVDTALRGRNIYDVLRSGNGSGVRIHQSGDVEEGFRRHLSTNRSRTISGYRVRIFFDNRQNSRAQSEKALNYFRASYPGIPAYRSYTNPFFKVTVGDFRTRSEAMQLLQKVISDFPSAFVVKENIEYPVADREHAFTVDTLKVKKYLLQ